MSATIQIDFSRPIALFPLPSVALFPHTTEWLVAFEPRYRQMVEDCLRARGDGGILDAAPIAMAAYAGRNWRGERIGEPPLRPVACVAKIVEHRALPDGRHQMLLLGVSRARIDSISEPEGRRLYRLARMTPLEARSGSPRRFPALERRLSQILSTGEIRRWERLQPVRKWIERGAVPTEVVVEQLVSMLARGDDARYAMLCEPSGRQRARFVLSELAGIAGSLDGARARCAVQPARGVHCN
jgi:Lon protease-like protein